MKFDNPFYIEIHDMLFHLKNIIEIVDADETLQFPCLYVMKD